MNKGTLILGIIVVAIFIGAGYWAYNANPVLISKVFLDPKNCTYIVEGKNITLKKGYSEIDTTPGSASKVVTNYFGNEVVGDFNGDGLPDTAFLLTQNSGGSGTFYYVVVALKSSNGCIGTNAILLGDRIAPQTTSFQNGQIVVNYADRKTFDPMTAVPSVGVSRYFKVSDGKLVEVITATVPPADWKTYIDGQHGFSFKYPAVFDTKYAQFQQAPSAIINLSRSKNIDSNGCYISGDSGLLKYSRATINSMQFCLSMGSSPGAGQLYNSYYYTTLRDGSYFTLAYIVHTLNGCGPYIGTVYYQPCLNFMNNYNTVVLKPIQDSVATFSFTNQISCTPNWQCVWGSCSSGYQSQVAADLNNCGVSAGSNIACPALARACSTGSRDIKNPGEKEFNFLVQKVNQNSVDGLWYIEYPVALADGVPKTLHIGDDVGYACTGKTATLSSIDFNNQSATFTELINTPPPGGCPI